MSNTNYTRPIHTDDSDVWLKVPFLVSMGESFTSTHEAFKAQFDVGNSGGIRYVGGANLSSPSGGENFLAYSADLLSKPYYKDTRLGGSEAINAYWGFNRDDDIVHPMMMTSGHNRSDKVDHDIGMGRVYASTIDRNQQVMWMSFGVPRFSNVLEFYKNAFDKDAVTLNLTGSTKGCDGALSAFVAGASLAWSFVSMPIKWLTGNSSTDMNRFYELRPTMGLYYRYVDSMMADWIVNTGLYGSGVSSGSLPISMRETGASIFDIIARRARNAGQYKQGQGAWEASALSWIAKHPKDYDEDADNPWSDQNGSWLDLVGEHAMGATQFVGFRIEKSTGSGESFSNSTQPSKLAESINSKIREMTSTRFDFGMGGGELQLGEGKTASMIEEGTKGMGQVLGGLAGSIGVEGLAAALTGGALVDIPEQWTSSDFGKSYSVSFRFVSPNGDIESIRRSVIIPTLLLMAGVLPRMAGMNSFSAPFLCKAYCKGMFSVPLGIIDSLSIERGGAEFGWSYGKLPMCINISMSIKDLSPAMYMGMHDSMFAKFDGVYNSFKEFMMTMAGTGLHERINRREQIERKVQFTAHQMRNQLMNENMWAFWASSGAIATTISKVVSFLGFDNLPDT